jgi:hypothetical protein
MNSGPSKGHSVEGDRLTKSISLVRGKSRLGPQPSYVIVEPLAFSGQCATSVSPASSYHMLIQATAYCNLEKGKPLGEKSPVPMILRGVKDPGYAVIELRNACH